MADGRSPSVPSGSRRGYFTIGDEKKGLEHRSTCPIRIGAGIIASGLYGFVGTLQPDANFERMQAAYGGVSVAGSLIEAAAAAGACATSPGARLRSVRRRHSA